MGKTTVRYTFWHWFGLVSAFIFLIAISIFVYSYLQQRKLFRLKAHIEVSPFLSPPNIDFKISAYQENEMIEKIKNNLPEKSSTRDNAEALYKAIYFDFIKFYPDYLKKFHTYYKITLSNPGDQPAEEINIEMKGRGKYLLDDENGNIEFDDFQNRINIDELSPGKEITLFVWSDLVLKDYTTYEPKSVVIYCKEGDAMITWPVKVEGITAWNAIHNNYPLIFAVSSFLVIVIVLMIVFFNIGCREMEEKAEIKEEKSSQPA